MKASGNHHTPGWLLSGTVAYLAAVFVVDLSTPQSLDIWVLYLPLILVLIRLNAPRQIIATAMACAVLMTLDTLLQYHGFGITYIFINLVMRIVAIWLVALAGVIIVNSTSRRRELEREVLETANREQQRIGRELHDSVGQELTALGLMANALVLRLQCAQPESQIVERLISGLVRVQHHIRTLSHGLVPVPIEAKGLWAALDDLAVDTTEKTGVPVRFHAPQRVAVSDHAMATHLYRIAQEAVHNALRHGHPQHINLTLLCTGDELCLSIEDDGSGIQAPSPESTGMGLRIMQYRAEQIGGALQFLPRDHGGTVVTCALKSNIWKDTTGNDEPENYAVAGENLDR
jgi:signal transduction histidine kinase